MFRSTSMRRAVIEAVCIFLAGEMLALVPITFWQDTVYPLILVVRLVLGFSPPVWAALRVKSTRREKMSRRFWWLGPRLAIWCTGANALVALVFGQASQFGGVQNGPVFTRLLAHGPAHLALGTFVVTELMTFMLLAVYFTIAVVCTRLANGGFLRFTMPAGNGRVTL